MKDLNSAIPFPDEVDRIVDRMLADPESVESLKDVLRSRIAGAPSRLARRRVEAQVDQDDPWDNMPV